LLQMIVDNFRNWLLSHIVWYLHDDVFLAVVRGLDKATRIHKNSWTRTTDNRVFTKVLYGIMKFIEIVVIASKRDLLLDQVPQILRNKLYCHVAQMPSLIRLNLGSGSGGTVTEAFEDKFISGISTLSHLKQLTLRYDCTDKILQVTAEVCRYTLTLLDIERSLKVTDIGASHIQKCRKLKSLDIFRTNISLEGRAELLVNLDNLEDLPRGDFLCEAVEHIFETNPDFVKRKKLKLKGFWASEEYFFHSSDQIDLVARLCPKIEKMLFMFNNQEAVFRDIVAFNNLKELDVWGGEFYTDEFYAAVEQLGPKLTKLNLVHIEELDARAILLLSQSCSNLNILGFYNCGFREPTVRDDEAFLVLDRVNRRDEDILMFSASWLDLEKLNITSEIGDKLLTMIISMGLNLKYLSLGMNTSISDAVLTNVFAANSMQKLESFKCADSKSLSLKTVTTLMDQCPHLTACHDLDYWESISPQQLTQFKQYLKQSNIKLKISDEKESELDYIGGLCTTANLPENLCDFNN